MENPLEMAWVSLQVRWDMFSGNQKSRTNSVGQVNGELRFGTHLHNVGWVGGEFIKGTVVSASPSVPGKSYPDPCPSSHLPEASQFSSSLCVSGISQTASSMLELRVSEFVSE